MEGRTPRPGPAGDAWCATQEKRRPGARGGRTRGRRRGGRGCRTSRLHRASRGEQGWPVPLRVPGDASRCVRTRLRVGEHVRGLVGERRCPGGRKGPWSGDCGEGCRAVSSSLSEGRTCTAHVQTAEARDSALPVRSLGPREVLSPRWVGGQWMGQEAVPGVSPRRRRTVPHS